MRKDRKICTFIDKKGEELATIFHSGVHPDSGVVDLVLVNPAYWESGLWFPDVASAKRWCVKWHFFTREYGKWKHYK